jgi:hypothetical protein
MSPDRADRVAARWLFALLLLTGLLLAPGYVDNVDSRIIVRTASRLVHEHTWSLGDVGGTYMASPEYGLQFDGAYQMKFGLGNALLAVPFVVAGGAAFGYALPPERAAEAGASLASALWFAVAGVLVFRICRRCLPRGGAVLAALAYSFGTFALVYGKSAYLETPLTVAVLSAYAATLALRERPASRGAAAALGLACVAVLWIKLAACLLLIGLVPVVFSRGVRAPLRGVLVAGVLFAAGVAALGWTNWARFGNPLESGYGGSLRFGHPLLDGAGQLLFGLRGGVFVYAPLLLLAIPGTLRLARDDGALALGLWLAFAASLLLYATFFSPFGGDAWGPRYLLPNVALLVIPAGVALHGWVRAGGARRVMAVAVLTCSALLQVPPALVSFHEVYTLRDVAKPAAVGPQQLVARILVEKARSGAGYDLAHLGLPAGRHDPQRVERGLNLWPVRVANEHPRLAIITWSAWSALAVGIAAASIGLWRATRNSA